MFRFAFAILLIANLLVCPLRCFSCQAGEAVDGDRAPATCCCQDVQTGENSPNDDQSPQDDCSCPNCICEGATIQYAPKVPAADACTAVGPWIVPADDLRLRGNSFPNVVTSDRSVCFFGGRAALVTYQCWLI